MHRRRVAIAAVAIALLIAAPLVAGELLVRASRGEVGDPPPDLKATHVEFDSESGARLRGWLARGMPDSGAVLLMHGVRADRRMMLERARFLHRAGYSVLLFDFQAHGESTGDRITYGVRESEDARTALAFLRTAAPGSKVGIIGASLGGAAALLATPRLEVDAMVLEAVFPSIERATFNRVRAHLGNATGSLSSMLLWQLRPRLGIAPTRLRPIDHIRDASAPVFVVAGDADRFTPIEESRELFDRARGLKEFWAVPGAGHVDLHAYAPREYESRVLRFLDAHLRERSNAGVYESQPLGHCKTPQRERVTLHPDGRFELRSPICVSSTELSALMASGFPNLSRDGITSDVLYETSKGHYERRANFVFIEYDDDYGIDAIATRRHGRRSTEARWYGDSLYWPVGSARDTTRLFVRRR